MRRARRAPAALLLAGLAAAFAPGSRADSPAGPPPVQIHCEGVGYLAVGSTVRFRIHDYQSWKYVEKGVHWTAAPTDVATIGDDGTLYALAPGRVLVNAKVDGIGEPLPRAITVLPKIEGGRLPRIEGLPEAKTPVAECRSEWYVQDKGPPGGLLLDVYGDDWAFSVRINGGPKAPLPWIADATYAWYGPLDPHKGQDQQTPWANKAKVTMTSWKAHVATGHVDWIRTDGTPLVMKFAIGMETPLAQEIGALVEAGPVEVDATGGPSTAWFAAPRGTDPVPLLLAIPPESGLDDDARRAAVRFAAEGYAVLAADIYEGRLAPDPLTIAEGHVPPDPKIAREKAAVARGVDDARAFAVLDASLAALSKKAGPRGAGRKIGLIGWGLGGEWALRLARSHKEIAATVVCTSPVRDDPSWLSALPGSVCGVFGRLDPSPTPDEVRAFDEALTTAHVPHEVRSFDNASHAFVDPRWPLGYGPEPTLAANARIVAFLRRTLQ
jgi:carboxymethylenebutenolidase